MLPALDELVDEWNGRRVSEIAEAREGGADVFGFAQHGFTSAGTTGGGGSGIHQRATMPNAASSTR